MNRMRVKSAQELYAAAYFKSSFTNHPRRTDVWKEVCRYLQRFIPRHAVVMDLGAGYCDFINHIAAAEKHAVDIFERLKDYARKEVHIHIQSCTDLSNFSAGHFDVVFASNLLEHLERQDLYRAVSEIHRVLKGGGKLICLQPNFRHCYRSYFDDFTHIQIFTERSLSELLQTFGFKIFRSFPRFLPVNMKSKLKLNIPFLRQVVRIYLISPIKPLAGQMLVVAEKVHDD